jgi:biopolymer transport protein TolR
MSRTARFVALAGITAGLLLSLCGCRWLSGLLPSKSPYPPIDMVTAESAYAMVDAGKVDAIVVTVLRNGTVCLGNAPESSSLLTERVRELLPERTGKEAFIRADARARFLTVERVIDSLSAAGIDDVGLLVHSKSANAQQNYAEPQQNPTGLELDVLSPSVMREHFPKGIPESMVTVTILHGPSGTPTYKINRIDVQKAELPPKLTEMYRNGAERILFIRGDGDLDFASIVEAIDIAKGADVDHVAVLTPWVAAGH